jgi:light-regulated signal transduction histidine kinase (bacteriophytochrome)
VLQTLTPEMEGRKLDIRLAELPPVMGDPILLRQVLVNLLSNAIKYSRPRDSAVIEVGALPATDLQEGPVFYVRDNGVGFDIKHADKLFGVFQRLHRTDEFEGTGVGLAIVQRIIHRHGGRIWPEATPGKGATFYFTLPGNNGDHPYDDRQQ